MVNGQMLRLFSRKIGSITTYAVMAFMLIPNSVFSQRYFYEGFENRSYPPDNTTLPAGWTQSYVSGTVNWEFQNGGHTKYPQYPYTRKPYPAYAGSYNALFQKESFQRQTTKLITPPIDISYSSKPMLRFWHAQANRFFFENYTNDELRVYYRTSPTGSWVQLAEYTAPVDNWTERTILLPDAAKSTTLYLAFEGRAMPGWGTCVDEVEVIETDTIPKSVDGIFGYTPSVNFVGTGTTTNQILRLSIKVKGNQGTLNLQNLTVQCVNTNNNDIAANGVKLFYTVDSIFNEPTLIGTASVSSNQAVFSPNFSLPYGISYFWITYDIASNATVGNTVDARIMANGITINGNTYPSSTIDPAGNRQIIKSIFFDDFESNKGWTLTGDFERNIPTGKGGSTGNPDPTFAISGTKVLGTDLTIDGDYTPSAPMMTATTPSFNLTYYKNVRLLFDRWLNVELTDNARVQVSTDNGFSWQTVYENSNYVLDKSWQQIQLNISSVVDRKNNVKIRFTLGPTNESVNFSGWNIDNFLLVGDSIKNDISITQIAAPSSNCGLGNEQVKIWIKNTGPIATPTNIPVEYSKDNGTTWVSGTVTTSIPVGDSILYTFPTLVNLSTVGTYSFKVRTTWSLDDYSANNQTDTTVISYPLYQLPYSEDFESSQSFWAAGGDNYSWEKGSPTSTLYQPIPSGNNVWKTSLMGYYGIGEDGYITSSCVNIVDTSKVIVELKYCANINEGAGARLEYSIDNGQTWSIVPSHVYPWSWNWYTNNNIEALEGPGWDDRDSAGWKTARQVLPANVLNQSVKFRVVFKSNYNDPLDGFAFDDFKVYKAPINIKLNNITSPVDACQRVNSNKISFTVQNNGIRALIASTDKIIAAFKVNSQSVVIDTLTLPSNLAIGATATLTFNKSANFDAPGTYTITVYHIDPNKGFYPVADNDTLQKTVTIYGAPVTGLKKEYATARLDTFTIQANVVANCTYHWANSSNPNLSSTSSLSNPPADTIWLTMQYTTGTMCSTTDTFYVRRLIPDIGVIGFSYPVDTCELPDTVVMKVKIKNLGTDTLAVGSAIRIKYVSHLSTINFDTLTLTQRFFPNQIIEHVCKKDTLDLSATGQVYTLKARTYFDYDSINTNDSLEVNIHTWGYPTVDLGTDRTSAGYDTITLTGYKTYLWSDNSNDSVYVARYRGNHFVRVTDNHNCPAYDTVNINVAAHDMSPILLNSPQTACALSSAEYINVKLKNVGTDTIQIGETAYLKYSINGGSWINDSHTFTSELHPYDSIDIQFSTPYNLSAIGNYNIKIALQLAGDIDKTNDTLVVPIEVYGYPIVELGPNRTVKAVSDTIDAGYNANYNYTWHDNSHNHFIVIDTTMRVKVTVTHNVNGCVSKDSVDITFEKRDGGITNTNLPLEACHGTVNQVQVEFTNKGNMNILADDTVIFCMKINNDTTLRDTVRLTAVLTPGGKLLHQFTNIKSLLPVGNNEIWFYSILTQDIDNSNDTLKPIKTINIQTTPYVDFGGVNDTIITTPPYVLQAPVGSGYAYTWQNPTHYLSSYTVTSSGLYHVEVETPYGCKDRDTVYVRIFIPDLAVTDVLSVPEACAGNFDTATIVIKNTGNVSVAQGQEILLGYKFGNKPQVLLPFTMHKNLSPNDTIRYTFRGLASQVVTGINQIRYFVVFGDDVVSSNDTAYATLTINPLPPLNLLGGLDSVEWTRGNYLSANLGSNYNYLWNTGETTEEIIVNNEQMYKVTATHKTTGCSKSDSVYVRILIFDIAVTDVDLPTTECTGEIDSVEVKVTNVGNQTFSATDYIVVTAFFEDYSSLYKDTVLVTDFTPGNTLNFTISGFKSKLTSGNRVIKFYAHVTFDENENDTVVKNITVYALPNINFGDTNDTLTIVKGDAVSAGLDKNTHTFLWNNGKTTDTIHVYNEGLYWVQATQTSTGCINRDTVYINVETIDAAVTEVTATGNVCTSAFAQVQLKLENKGTLPITSGKTVNYGLKVGNSIIKTGSTNLSSNLNPGNFIYLNLTGLNNLMPGGNNIMKVYAKITPDTDNSNDTLQVPITLYPTYQIEQDYAICIGESYNGHTQEGTYTDYFTTVHGCDSVVITHLSVGFKYKLIDTTICQGQNVRGYTTSGTYFDTIPSVAGCDSIIELRLTVNPVPTIQLADGSSSKIVTFPYEIQLSFLNSENPNDFNYLWNDNSTNRNLTASFAGNYSVVVSNKVTGCSSTRSISLDQVDEYDLSVNSLKDYLSSSCTGQQNNLTVEIKNTGTTYVPAGSEALVKIYVKNVLKKTIPVSFTAHFTPSQTTNINAGDISTYLVLGNNAIKAEVELAKDINTSNNNKTTTINLTAGPTVSLENGKDTVYFTTSTYTIDAGIGYDSYLWNTGSTGRFLTISSSGKYSVIVSKNGCTGSDTIVAMKRTDVTTAEQMQINIYPNPASDRLTIEVSGIQLKQPTIEVISADQKLVLKKNIVVTNGKLNEVLNVGAWEKGVYILRIIDTHVVLNELIVIQ